LVPISAKNGKVKPSVRKRKGDRVLAGMQPYATAGSAAGYTST
jgi:hypothetical protein